MDLRSLPKPSPRIRPQQTQNPPQSVNQCNLPSQLYAFLILYLIKVESLKVHARAHHAFFKVGKPSRLSWPAGILPAVLKARSPTTNPYARQSKSREWPAHSATHSPASAPLKESPKVSLFIDLRHSDIQTFFNLSPSSTFDFRHSTFFHLPLCVLCALLWQKNLFSYFRSHLSS